MESLLSCRNLTKEYILPENSVHAISKITLDINKGDFICFMGPSGSGKTTLLNILGLLDVPTEGELLLNGISTLQMSKTSIEDSRRKFYGYVFQRPNLIYSLSNYRNIEIPLLIKNQIKGSVDRKKLIFEILKVLDLEDKAYRFPPELSLGQQQRIALARAVIHKPAILLLDEPTGSLDRDNSNIIVEILRKIYDLFSPTILIVTHDNEVAKIANKIYYLENGEIKS